MVVSVVIAEASDEEALPTVVLVLPLTSTTPAEILAASDEEALKTSDWSANAPDESVPAVRVREPKLHTCDAVRFD